MHFLDIGRFHKAEIISLIYYVLMMIESKVKVQALVNFFLFV
jgi:hypothetical protein